MIEHDAIIQRYDLAPYAMGWEKNDDGEVCMSTDVDKLEAEHQKLLQEHRVMKQALKWIADDNYTHFKKREIAINTLKYVGEVTS